MSGRASNDLSPRPMGPRHAAVRAVWAIILSAVVVLAVTSCSSRQEPFQDFPGLLTAIQGYSQDLRNRGQPLPKSVSLSELVKGGYISKKSVRAFEGMETRVWLSGNPAAVDSVLISARLADGSVSAALADGSVQQFTAQGFAQHLQKTGQQEGAGTRSQ